MVLLGNGSRENTGDTGIDRVAALPEDAHARFHFHAVAGASHLMRGADLGKHGGCVQRGS